MSNTAHPQLWVPHLTHYYRDETDTAHVDIERTAAHIRQIRAHVKGFLIAGSTGDGWDLTEAQFRNLLEITIHPNAFDSTCRYLIGCLGRTTEAVLQLANIAEDWVTTHHLEQQFAGLTVCPPVDAFATQAQIQTHFQTVLSNTTAPIAVYQLPQITQCELDADTLTVLAETGRVPLFKDTSGADRVAKAGFNHPAVFMVRGAEGNYFEALKPNGRYDGFLLSTANCFGAQLENIIQHANQGQQSKAAEQSAQLSQVVTCIFERASGINGTNPFSDSNRAVDHIVAHGADWRAVPAPLLVIGTELPFDFIEFAEREIAALDMVPEQGYLTN